MRLLFGNTEVRNQWKYTLPAESSPFRRLYFRSISMAVLGNRYDSNEKTRKYRRQNKKPQLAPGWWKQEKIDCNDYRACGTVYINFTSL